ncbi:MAG: hypothetical protein AAGI63_05215 [Planctomycetota bacterium]
MDPDRVIFIHPVHAAFPFADLSLGTDLMGCLLDYLEGLDVDDRYQLIDEVAPLVGLVQARPLRHEDQRIRRWRMFQEACCRLAEDETLIVRGIVQQILNDQFQAAWPDFLLPLLDKTPHEQTSVLSCTPQALFVCERRLRSLDSIDEWQRIDAFRRYNLVCERVAGPLIGYC